MPEERNRIIVDSYSKIKFAPTRDALENLKNENLHDGSFLVGDLMLDLFKKSSEKIEYSSNHENYILCTIHRKSNLEEKRIKEILKMLNTSHINIKLIVHPALKFALSNLKIGSLGRNIEQITPQSYISTLELLKSAKGVITDSGGLQKESYWMGKPTLIPRTATEWHETTKEQICQLDYNLNSINSFAENGKVLKPDFHLFGNGQSSENIWSILLS